MQCRLILVFNGLLYCSRSQMTTISLAAAHCTWSCFCVIASSEVNRHSTRKWCTHLPSRGGNCVAPPTTQKPVAMEERLHDHRHYDSLTNDCHIGTVVERGPFRLEKSCVQSMARRHLVDTRSASRPIRLNL